MHELTIQAQQNILTTLLSKTIMELIMSTPENKVNVPNLPTDVPTLHHIISSATAQLMAHAQTVQELIKANMDLRAALHLSQADKTQLNQHVEHVANTFAKEPEAAAPEAVEPAKVEATDAHTV